MPLKTSFVGCHDIRVACHSETSRALTLSKWTMLEIRMFLSGIYANFSAKLQSKPNTKSVPGKGTVCWIVTHKFWRHDDVINGLWLVWWPLQTIETIGSILWIIIYDSFYPLLLWLNGFSVSEGLRKRCSVVQVQRSFSLDLVPIYETKYACKVIFLWLFRLHRCWWRMLVTSHITNIK